MTPEDIGGLDWSKGGGLLPAIVQDAGSGTVLMTGCVNPEALRVMLERREVVLYSRTRRRLWVKGETSGHRIRVDRIVSDCDRDALLVLGRPSGPVCHTGERTCFRRFRTRGLATGISGNLGASRHGASGDTTCGELHRCADCERPPPHRAKSRRGRTRGSPRRERPRGGTHL